MEESLWEFKWRNLFTQNNYVCEFDMRSKLLFSLNGRSDNLVAFLDLLR